MQLTLKGGFIRFSQLEVYKWTLPGTMGLRRMKQGEGNKRNEQCKHRLLLKGAVERSETEDWLAQQHLEGERSESGANEGET